MGVWEGELERKKETKKEQKSFSVTKTSPSVHAREKHPHVCSAFETPFESLWHSLQKRLLWALAHSSFLKISSFSPCDRSKLLRWNHNHPSWHWSEGGRLHHLSVPQRGLVEACAVLAAGVPQRSDVVIETLRSWREGHRCAARLSAQGTAHLVTARDWLAGAQFLWQTEMAGQVEIHGHGLTYILYTQTHTCIKVLGRIITVCLSSCDEFILGWTSWNISLQNQKKKKRNGTLHNENSLF